MARAFWRSGGQLRVARQRDTLESWLDVFQLLHQLGHLRQLRHLNRCSVPARRSSGKLRQLNRGTARRRQHVTGMAGS